MEFFKENIHLTEVLVQLVAFLIVFGVLKKFAWKPLLAIIKARRERFEDEWSGIEKSKQSVAALEKDYLAHLQKIEEEARAKLEKWLKPFLADESEENQEKVAKVLAAPPIKHDGRGLSNTGKVWMINHTIKVRARVPAEDVEASKAAGWVFGGPRTPFV